MDLRARMRMRRRWPLLLLLLAAACVLLFAADGPMPRGGEELERARADLPEAAGVRHEEAGATGLAVKPDARLEGRGEVPRPEGDHGPVRVHVEGPGGAPVPDVVVSADSAPGGSREEVTGAGGDASFPDLPYDAGVVLTFRTRSARAKGSTDAHVLPPWGGGAATRRVRGPEICYVAETGLRLELRTLDATSGRGLQPNAAKVVTKEGRIPPRRLEPGTFLVCPPVGRATPLQVQVTPPRGWLAWDGANTGTAISPYAKELLFVYPLRRERTAWITVNEADGSPADARVRRVHVAGRSLPSSHVRGDAFDRFRVTGIPHLPGEPLRVTAGTGLEDFVGSATATVPIPDDVREEIRVLVTLPPLRHVLDLPTLDSVIGLGGGAGGAFGGRSGRHGSLPVAGTVTVTVRRRDGSPAVNALVRIGGHTTRTDRSGRAQLGGVMPGTRTVEVEQVGLLPTMQRVEVKSGGTVHVDLREPVGGSLDVEVVDDRGRGLSFASLRVDAPSGRPWVDLRGDRQRLDPFCDRHGRRSFATVEPGTLHVTATWGTRSKSVRATVTRGQRCACRIVLPRPMR